MPSRFHIILALTGSIATPKGLQLFTKLQSHPLFKVTLIATKNAMHFINDHNQNFIINHDIFKQNFYTKQDHIFHTDINNEVDLFVCFPASLNFMAQCAYGMCDTLPALVYHACTAHKMIQPAMNEKMYLSPACQRALQILQQDGVEILTPKQGQLACNTFGIGRAWEVDEMYQHIMNFYKTYSSEKL